MRIIFIMFWKYSTFRIGYRQRKVIKNSLWKILFCAVCGGVIEQAAGTMELPLVNGFYRNNMDCRFVFRQPEGKRVAITFTKFNLQQKASDGKCIDYVEVLSSLLKLFLIHARYCAFNLIQCALNLGFFPQSQEQIYIITTTWKLSSLTLSDIENKVDIVFFKKDESYEFFPGFLMKHWGPGSLTR